MTFSDVAGLLIAAMAVGVMLGVGIAALQHWIERKYFK